MSPRITKAISYEKSINSLACAWELRSYSASLDGFYLGYHAAAAILEEIEPCHFAAPKLERNIFCMEHHLGYIQSDAAQS